MEDEEGDMLVLINRERELRGLRKLKKNDELNAIAEQRAEERYQRRMAGVKLPEGEEILALNAVREAPALPAEEKDLLHIDYTRI